MATQVIMPQLGESVVEGTVGRWLIAEGQPVQQYDPLVEVTTDKVDTEITATASGVLLKIYVPEGQTVERGTVLALIGQPGEAVPDAPPPVAAPHAAGPQPGAVEHEAPVEPPVRGEPVAPMVVPVATPVAQRMALEHGLDLADIAGHGPGGRITKEDVEAHLSAGEAPAPAGARPADAGRPTGFISPAVARLAAEHQIDLAQVKGTGEGGRISKKDVQAYLAARPAAVAEPELPPWERPGTGSLFKPSEELPEPEQLVAQPAPAHAPARPIPATPPAGGEVRPLSSMRRSIAKHMVLSRHTSAHVTTVMEADMTRVVQAREQLKSEYERQGTRLTFTPFFVQAIVAGLKAVPEANSSFQASDAGGEERLLLHRHIHIGIAVAIPDGLIVPILRNADEKSLLGLARAVNDLSDRARSKRLTPDDVQGGTFTLTNHGTAGSLLATPIINQPQAGILGVGAIQKRPVVISRSPSLLPGPDDSIAIRPMVYLSFSFDHRILDGAGADNFLAAVRQYLEAYTA